jgi:2,6-dihydroxypseudooxynicotine hydrolase
MSAVIQAKAEKDARVEAAISHWAPRFVANGVPLADFQEVTASVQRWEDWCDAWSARAAIHRELGNKASAGGYNYSAAQHFTRAAVCYHFGKFLFVNDMAQLREAHRLAVECRNKALPYLDPPGERVAIPYEGKQLYGNLRKPKGVAKPPVVCHVHGPRLRQGGERRLREPVPRTRTRDARVRRARPGRGRYDSLSAVPRVREAGESGGRTGCRRAATSISPASGSGACRSAATTRARAAAFEKRFKAACVAPYRAPSSARPTSPAVPQMNVEAFRVRSKSANLEEAGKVALRFTLAECAKNISSPDLHRRRHARPAHPCIRRRRSSLRRSRSLRARSSRAATTW